jgi:hypothetical protein
MDDSVSLYAPPINENVTPVQPDERALDAQIAAMTNQAKTAWGPRVVMAGTCLFGVSLLLPATKITIFQTTTVNGLVCAVMAGLATVDKPLSILPLLTLGNLWMLLLPLLSRSRSERTLTIAALVAWIGPIAALALNVVPDFEKNPWLIGYHVWVIALVVAAAGITRMASARSAQARDERRMQSLEERASLTP